MKRKIAYITGARADYCLMISVLKAIQQSDKFKLQVYATSNHLMKEFGYTFDQVKQDFPEATIIEAIFESDDRIGMAKFLGPFISKFVEALSANPPDLALIPCDRIEAFAAAVVCTYLGIPICHVHGGERTFTVDEQARHAMTKLAHIHFVATEDAAKRIEKMGEEKWRIHVVGAPMLDTQHPVSEEFDVAGRQMEETIRAVKTFNLPVIVVYPHADAGGRRIIEIIEREKKNKLFHIFPHIPNKQFLALEREAAVWVGNSSAGIIESASFKLPVVNVGIRQLGRERSGNVIDVNCNAGEIKRAIEKSLYDQKYRQKISRISNVWGGGNAAKRVVKTLEKLEIGPKLLTKQITY